MRRLEEQADNMRRLEIASGPRREKDKEREREGLKSKRTLREGLMGASGLIEKAWKGKRTIEKA